MCKLQNADYTSVYVISKRLKYDDYANVYIIFLTAQRLDVNKIFWSSPGPGRWGEPVKCWVGKKTNNNDDKIRIKKYSKTLTLLR